MVHVWHVIEGFLKGCSIEEFECGQHFPQMTPSRSKGLSHCSSSLILQPCSAKGTVQGRGKGSSLILQSCSSQGYCPSQGQRSSRLLQSCSGQGHCPRSWLRFKPDCGIAAAKDIVQHQGWVLSQTAILQPLMLGLRFQLSIQYYD